MSLEKLINFTVGKLILLAMLSTSLERFHLRFFINNRQSLPNQNDYQYKQLVLKLILGGCRQFLHLTRHKFNNIIGQRQRLNLGNIRLPIPLFNSNVISPSSCNALRNCVIKKGFPLVFRYTNSVKGMLILVDN